MDILGLKEIDPSLLGSGASLEVQSPEESLGGILDGKSEEELGGGGGGIKPRWVKGQDVEVYSRSKKQWIPATVRKIMEEEGECWVQVHYKNMTQMKDLRADSQLIRKVQATPAGAQPTPAAPRAMAASTSARSESKSELESHFTQLSHKVSVLSRQVEQGLYLLKRVASVLSKLAKHEIEHISLQQRALESERQKVRDKSTDDMEICVKAWHATEEYLAQLLERRGELARNLLSQIVNPMMQFYADAELKRKIIEKDERKYGVEMTRAQVGVKKNLKNCQRLVHSCVLAKEQAEGKNKLAAGKGKKSKFGGVFNFIKNITRGSLPDLQAQTATAAKNYVHSIEYANEKQQQYLKKELPLVCRQFEMLERSRLNAVRKYLLTLNSLSKQHAEPLVQLTAKHLADINKMDAEADLRAFTAETVRMYGPTPPTEPFRYQLKCSLTDIRAGRFEGNPNSFFCSTLEHCMEMQRADAKVSKELKVPVVLTHLIAAIRQLEGYSTEGIFRLSASQEALTRLRKQFDQGDYTVKVDSPHIPAGLLKQWLRELAEPLIPTPKYPDAIAIARNADAPPTDAQITAFVRSLPDINQRVLIELGKMTSQISSLASVNKMTFSNLAIVFAPGILRNPSEEPAELLENSKFETLFTKRLLETLAK